MQFGVCNPPAQPVATRAPDAIMFEMRKRTGLHNAGWSLLLRALALCAVCMACAPLRAAAAGGTLHIFMSELALEQVRDPELKQLLEKHRDIVLWASWYPDSGYAGGNTYGEYSHWTPFLDGYLDYIHDTAGQNHQDYGFLVAHLLGAAAHSIQDQAFDHILLLKTQEMDGHGQELLDFGLDLVGMADHKRNLLKLSALVERNPTKYTPVAHLLRVYDALNAGFERLDRQIPKGQRLLAMAMGGEKIVHAMRHQDIREQSPWAAANYYQAPGGVLHNARITAAYWESLWKRLKGDRAGFFVFDVFPYNGGAVLSLNNNTVDADITVFFSRRYDNATITPDSFTVRDAAGNAVPGNFNWGYNSNMARFRPASPWPAAQAFTVTLTDAIRDIHGNKLPPYSFVVTTPHQSAR